MSGPVVNNHIWPQIAKKKKNNNNATRKTAYQSLSWDSQPVLSVRLQVRLMILRPVQHWHDVEVQAFWYWETSCEILQKHKTPINIRTPYRYGETCCEICEEFTEKFRRWWSVSIKGHPQALLMNQIRNVLQKWHRGNTVFSLTSRKTKIAKHAREPKLQGFLTRNALVMQYFVQIIFGDLITNYQKILGGVCESRNNHRHAVVVQDLATQWIQSYPCKTKTSQETQRSLQKFLEPERNPKVIYTDNSLEFGNACEDLSWNHRTSTPHRSETNGFAERAVRRIKEGTSAVLLQSGLDENVGCFYGMLLLSAKCSRPPVRWENTLWYAILEKYSMDQWFRLDPR